MRSLNEHKEELNEGLGNFLKKSKKYDDSDESRIQSGQEILDNIKEPNGSNLSSKLKKSSFKKSKDAVLSDIKNRTQGTVPNKYYDSDTKKQYGIFARQITDHFEVKQTATVINYLNKNKNTVLDKDLLFDIEQNYTMTTGEWKVAIYLFDTKMYDYLQANNNEMPTYKELIPILGLEKKYLQPAEYNPY